MIPVIREGETAEVHAASDTGEPKTIYVVSLYAIERDAASMARQFKRRKDLLAKGVVEGSQELYEATQEIKREDLAAVITQVRNAAGPDGKPVTLTDRADILAHLKGLTGPWFFEVAEAITKPEPISVDLGKD